MRIFQLVLRGLKSTGPSSVLFDHFVDFTRDTNRFGQGNDNSLVVGYVIFRKRAALAVLESLLADLVTADMEVPHGLAHPTEASGLRFVYPYGAARPRYLLHRVILTADEIGDWLSQLG